MTLALASNRALPNLRFLQLHVFRASRRFQKDTTKRWRRNYTAPNVSVTPAAPEAPGAPESPQGSESPALSKSKFNSREGAESAFRRKYLKDRGFELYPRFESPSPSSTSAMRIKSFRRIYEGLRNDQREDEKVTVCGRVRRRRIHSGSLVFIDLVEDGYTLQIVFSLRIFAGQGSIREQLRPYREGDIVSITGFPGRSSSGELSAYATNIQMLAPCLHTLPDALTEETSVHFQHIDLIVDPDSHRILRLRSRIIQLLRSFLVEREFIEIQTPILSYNAGGAVAQPFETEATNAYSGRKLNLRVAPELWLKRLVIGGLERIFEIGPQFRNEHADNTHNPEFTTCEFYQTYGNLESLMAMTEDLFRVLDANIKHLREYSKYFDGLPNTEFNFRDRFEHVEFVPKLEEIIGCPLPQLDNRATGHITKDLLTLFSDLNLEAPPNPTPARLLDKLQSHYLEPLCIRPTFITHHPEIMSPLAKTQVCPTTGRKLSLRFELFIDCKELANAYEEENDPAQQAIKFRTQNVANGKPKNEIDWAYVRAMEWGMPPTVGWGVGMDRLVMLFTGVNRISKVIPFGGIKGAVNQGGRIQYGSEGALVLDEGLRKRQEDEEQEDTTQGERQK